MQASNHTEIVELANDIADDAPTDNENIKSSIVRYLLEGEGGKMGHFLHGLFTDKFVETCTRADGANQAQLYEWAIWLYNRVPKSAWGSEQRVVDFEGLKNR